MITGTARWRRRPQAPIATGIQTTGLDAEVPPIAASPIATQMAEMPWVVDVSFHLLVGNLVQIPEDEDSNVDCELV